MPRGLSGALRGAHASVWHQMQSLKPRCKGQRLRNLFPVMANTYSSLAWICPSCPVLSSFPRRSSLALEPSGMGWMKPLCSGCV